MGAGLSGRDALELAAGRQPRAAESFPQGFPQPVDKVIHSLWTDLWTKKLGVAVEVEVDPPGRCRAGSLRTAF